MILVKANLGDLSEARYFEATEDKPRALYVGVVEQQRVQNEAGDWEDGDKVWYQARFKGADADWVRDTLRNGDPVLLWGNVRDSTREVDGKTLESKELFVDAVSINPRLRKVTIDRPVRQQQTQQASQAATHAVDAEVDGRARAAARATVVSRLHDVVGKRYIDGAVADQVVAAWDDPALPVPELGQATVSALRAGGANEAVVAYVSSVADEYAGGGHVMSWNEAAAAANPAPPANDTWTLVNQARRDVAAGASQSPGM
ncbi:MULTISPECIES: hypothetical protein [Leucobacter]|uniref:Single-stranded DNA-binding protein n=1 Tax=Leucobacter chromiiresistens TaxID=1079994 RepID=A0A1H0YIV9_9MICO|nr:hypothetical protein [Leucobacter chromiiresistens]SDQ15169.1 hypothetical protein SAMN04488565_0922 [Leucobacter chromiiresistens]